MLKELIEGAGDAAVQQTTFSQDVLGRYICSTWDEATANPAFDVIVLGAGMYGAYCAEKIYRFGADLGLRVLVLDAGSFLVSEHVQNLARIGLNAPGAITVDPGTPRNVVWGLPWRSQAGFPGLAYCVGGRSLYWGGWSPRLTPNDLANWPAEVAAFLATTYPKVEAETGVLPPTGFISGPLNDALQAALAAARPRVANLTAVEPAPLAVQGQAPASGLFSFDKFSSAPILCEALREAAGEPDDARRRFFLVPHAHVTGLATSAGRVSRIDAHVGGQAKQLSISPDTAVVLALGTIESTRLALTSFPTPLVGKNLLAHLRSNVIIRIPRDAIAPSLPAQLQAAAALVRGETANGRFHIQVTAAALAGTDSEATMFRMVPDIDLLDKMLKSQTAATVVITLRALGEMRPDASRWIDLSPYEIDEFGAQRAWANLPKPAMDDALWGEMDAATLALALALAGDPANLEYLEAGAWTRTPFVSRDGIGTTHHEAGTLALGADTDPTRSVTDIDGRFNHVANAYVAGPALFPTIGSANPALTAFALCQRTASAVVATARRIRGGG